MILVDTDITIDIQRGHQVALSWFAGLSSLPSIPGFVVMELIQSAQNKQQVNQAMKLVAPLPIVWPTQADSNFALVNFQRYHLSHGLGLIDALIAATAVGLTAQLCTHNVKHYNIVPDLVTIQPYSK